ncbi:hypothetical protein PFISCL1PPCAC_19511 [Pristionchus fissidentatus]|uniref:CID domain-containing protein n=1 Tax=Pristionchus fissidentatus TaxID=1538716 RepID=A0AAV5WBW6_9BILA|nr:hypothetical protein PFISCL1PPCAC_19511 [Pristionchus fissidentatus]
MERDVVAAFNAELASIYESRPPISKNKIVEITKAALKAIKFYKHVVFSVEKFLGKCKAEYKIPCLYVMDSILRQSKRQFKDKDVFSARFAKNFDTTLVVLLQCSPSDRMKIARTINLWEANGVFSPEKINEYRAICVANGLDTDRDAVEKAVKGEKADLTIYERHGEKDKKEHRHHEKHRETEPEHLSPKQEVIERPSEEIPVGGVSEATLMLLIQTHMFDMGTTVERDLTLLRQIHSMVLEKMKERVDKERNANKQVSVKKLLSSNFDYSDEEDNEEEKEEPKAPPPPTQEELDRLAESVVTENATDIRTMHGERIVKLQNAALEAKRAEAQRAAQEVMAQQEKDAAVAQAQKMAAQQQQAAAAVAAAAAASAASSQSSILGHAPPGPPFGLPPGPPPGPPFGLPPGMQLPPGLTGMPGIPQVSLAGSGGLSGLIQQNSIDNQIKALNSMFASNPLAGILGQGPPPQLNLQHNPLLRLNPQQLAALAGGQGPDLQALLSQPPPQLPHGMNIPPPALTQQQLQQLAGVGGGMGLGGAMAIPTSMNGPPSGAMMGMGGMMPHQALPFSPSKKPPSLMDLDQDVLAQMMQQAPPSDEMEEIERRDIRDEREEDKDRRRRSREGDRDRDRERDRGDRGERTDRGDRGDRRDRDRERSEHRNRGDHKDKKRKRSRSRERRGRSKDRSERDQDDKERRKMGLPSHPKDGTTTIASCTVWLGRLPQMSEDDLRSALDDISNIAVQMMPTRACAYVTVKDRRNAVKLLDKTKGLRVKGKEIKSSWAAGNGTKGEKWRSYWDEDRGISSIPHGELPLDAMHHLCDGGWLDVTTLPVHLRGIIDDEGRVIDQSASSTSALDNVVSHNSSHHSNSFLDLGQVQLPPTPEIPSMPNPMGHFPNLGLGGAPLMMPPGMPPLGGQFGGLGNGIPPFVPSPMRGGMRGGGMGGGRGGMGGGPPGGFMQHSPMGGRGRGDWRGGRGAFNNRGGGFRGGWNGGSAPPSVERQSGGGGFNERRRTNTRWNTDDTTVSSTTMNDDHDHSRAKESIDSHLTKTDNNSDDMEME